MTQDLRKMSILHRPSSIVGRKPHNPDVPDGDRMPDMESMEYTTAEMMAVAASRALDNRDVCFVGIGAPSLACNLARLTHAPDITLIYESGTIGTRPDLLPLSIGDPELCE